MDYKMERRASRKQQPGLESLIEGELSGQVGPRKTGRKPMVGKAATVAIGALGEEPEPLAVCRRGGPLRPSRARRQLPESRQRLSQLAALVRQNNQNSRNEPGMSHGINGI